MAYLPDGHRQVVLDTVVGHVAGRLPVLAGVIDTTTLRVIDHVRSAVAAGVDGIVVTAPFYTRTHPAEIDTHFRMIADRRGAAGLYAYDLPVSVHTKLGADLLLELAADGVLAGVKDSSGDEGGLRDVILGRATGRDISRLQRADRLGTDRRLRAVDGRRRGGAGPRQRGPARLRAALPCSLGRRLGGRASGAGAVAAPVRTRQGGWTAHGTGSSALGAFKAALHLRGVIDHPTTALPQIPLNRDEIDRVGKYLALAGLL